MLALLNPYPKCDFYTKCPNIEDLGAFTPLNPQEIISTLEKIDAALRTNSSGLPVFYWLRRKEWGPQGATNSMNAFLNRESILLHGGWDKCHACKWPPKHTCEILRDLRGEKEIQCDDVASEMVQSQSRLIPGTPMAIEIKPENGYMYFKKHLDKMLSVCLFARENGYSVQTHLF